ncbi:alpha/beta hydrolase [Pseudomonas sp. SWI6]|nr:alpha/beta hydrolase [Pseudomonas sp. SWI6]
MIPLMPTPSLLDQRFAERLLRLDGGQLAVRQAGDGDAVVLLHGIGSGAASWLHVAMGLSERARVLAWDAPGYGQSSPLPMAAPCARDYAGRLLQALDTLGVERCVLVGHSLGALTASAFAQACPERVNRLVLISPARGYGAVPDQGRAVRAERLHNLGQLGIERMARERSARLLSANASAEAQAWVHWNMARLKPHGYRQAIELLCGDDLLRYAPLAVACQVHCGSADGITLPEDCAALAAALAAPFDLIAGAGHACAIEQPDTVTGLLARALDASLTGSVL